MIQLQSRPNRVQHEFYQGEIRRVMPENRVPNLDTIVNQFLSGRPIDANLQRNLAYNDFERMPIYQKGFDLVDATKIAKENGATIEELNGEIQRAIDSKRNPPTPSRNTSEELPTNLNNE